MEDKQGVCVFISSFEHLSFLFFSYSPHGNIQQKPWDEFCWEVRMSMLIFFLLLRRLSLTEALVPSPMVTVLSVKGALSVSKSSLLCNQTLKNISASGCSVDRQTPTSGGCIDFQWGRKKKKKKSPQWAIQSSYFSTQPIFCCDCHACVLMPGCSGRLSCTGVTQASTLIYQYHTPLWARDFEPVATSRGKLLMRGQVARKAL